MNGTEGTEPFGRSNEAHGRNNQPQSFIYPILNGRNSSINSTQINLALNHQSAILNQSNLSNRLSKVFQSTWLSRLFLWITFLGSLMPLEKKKLPWAKKRPDGRRGTFSAGHDAMKILLWNMEEKKYACKERSFLCTMIAKNLTLSPTATSRADVLFTANLVLRSNRRRWRGKKATVFHVQFKQRK